jgi:hypothetical protein
MIEATSLLTATIFSIGVSEKKLDSPVLVKNNCAFP